MTTRLCMIHFGIPSCTIFQELVKKMHDISILKFVIIKVIVQRQSRQVLHLSSNYWLVQDELNFLQSYHI